MRSIAAVWRREFRNFWYSPVAYIIIIVYLGLSSWLFFKVLFVVGNADIRNFFSLVPWAFLFLMPALTMRQWAEERKTGTLELLMTQPVREWEVVLGKYLATLSLLLIVLLLTLPTTFTVAIISQNGLDWGVVFATYLGAFLLGAAYLAIGGWISSVTNNQVVAFILAVAVTFMLIIVGEAVVTLFVPSLLAQPMEYLGLTGHFASLTRGVVDTRDLVYYVSVVFLFLLLTVRAVESRKWS